MDKQPLLVMFVGVPGSGKSYFGRQLAERLGGVWLNNDSMRLAIWGSREEVRKTHVDVDERAKGNAMVFGAMNYAASRILVAGTTVIYDSNANGRRERAGMQQLAADSQALAVVIRIKTPFAIALQRGQEREETDDQRQLTEAKMREVIERHGAEIDEPGADENVIEMSGEIAFDDQYESFQRQLLAIHR